MENYVIALDLGTESTSVIVAVVDESERFGIKVLHQETMASQGMKRGVIDNPEKVKMVVNNLIIGAERKIKKSNQTRKWYVANIGGRSYYCEISRYDRSATGISVTDVLLKRMLDEAKGKVKISAEEELVRFVPVFYSLDSSSFIKSPIGYTPNKIEGFYMSIIVAREAMTLLNNLFPKTSKASFSQVYTSATAKATILLSEEEKKNGTLLVDLGAGTTNIAIASKGSVCYDVSIPFGSNTITNDIAVGLGIDYDKAEKLKTTFGLSYNSSERDRLVNISLQDEEFECDLGQLDFIIRARVEEIIKYVDSALVKGRQVTKVNSVVLAGGGAALKGICDLFKDYLGMPVSCAQMPMTKIDATENLSVALGMASLFARENKSLFEKPEPELFAQQEEVPQPPDPVEPEEPKIVEAVAPEKKREGSKKNLLSLSNIFKGFDNLMKDADGPSYGEEKKD